MTKVYQLHPAVQEAYSDVHSWLAGRPAASGYLDISHRQVELDSPDMLHVAAQFALLFHAHHFKTSFIFNEILTHDRLVSWLGQNQHITLIDMGCGAGAASAALTATLIELIESERITNEVTLVCIGVDLVENVLGIYNKLMECLQENVRQYNIRLEAKIVDRPASESVTDLDMHLQKFLHDWKQPALSQVIIAQSNIVRPLSSLFKETLCRQSRLIDLGIPSGTFLEEEKFGIREVRSYRQLFVQLPIDNLHILTVGTNKDHWIRRVEEMGDSVAELFQMHDVHSFGTCIQSIDFVNPEGSHWREKNETSRANNRKFVTDVRSVANTKLAGDTHWHRIISKENLELAWARVRSIRMREALCDQIEIRLFESDLECNLQRLQRELKSYNNNVANTDDRLLYSFPKGDSDERPYVLPRLEEDIGSVAIIQVLGNLAFGLQNTSYAYRPHDSFPRPTEYLYQYWFDAHRRFKDDIRIGVGLERNCNILKADIEKYYTNINQEQLVDAVVRELRTQSSRVRWLLEKLLLVELDSVHHDCKYGLSQGGAGSGFYANAFLVSLDSSFGIGDVRFYRYVDDMYLVVPASSSLQEAATQLDNELKDLGLNRNPDKSRYYNAESYSRLEEFDDQLDDVSRRFKYVTNCLWFSNRDYRRRLQETDNWWPFIDFYCKRLRTLEIYIERDRLSRKLHQYLSRRKRRNDCDNNLVKELILPAIDAEDWVGEFESNNNDWIKCRCELRRDMIDRLQLTYEKWKVEESEDEKPKLASKVLFYTNRLSRLGFHKVEEFIADVLIKTPSAIRQPRIVMRGLGNQGFSGELIKILGHYVSSGLPSASYYVALVLDSLQLLPELPENVAETIVRLATNSEQCDIVRLKATETLLRTTCGNAVQAGELIRRVTSNEEKSHLLKNYWLLLGHCNKFRVEDPNCSDYMLDICI